VTIALTIDQNPWTHRYIWMLGFANSPPPPKKIKHSSYLKILGARRLTWSKIPYRRPTNISATEQNLVTTALHKYIYVGGGGSNVSNKLSVVHLLRATFFLSFTMAQQPHVRQGLLTAEASRYHTRLDSSERMISPTQGLLPHNTLQSQKTHIHVPGGIRTRNLSKRAGRPTP
jgi:hypothetical protein